MCLESHKVCSFPLREQEVLGATWLTLPDQGRLGRAGPFRHAQCREAPQVCLSPISMFLERYEHAYKLVISRRDLHCLGLQCCCLLRAVSHSPQHLQNLHSLCESGTETTALNGTPCGAGLHVSWSTCPLSVCKKPTQLGKP